MTDGEIAPIVSKIMKAVQQERNPGYSVPGIKIKEAREQGYNDGWRRCSEAFTTGECC